MTSRTRYEPPPVALKPPYEDAPPSAHFLLAAAAALEISDFALWQSGATTHLDAQFSGLPVQLTYGAIFWLKALLWPTFGRYESHIFRGRKGSYLRVKLTEGRKSPDLTGNRQFDDRYVILGKHSAQLAQDLPRPAQRLLIDHAGMDVDVVNSSFEPPEYRCTRGSDLDAILRYIPRGFRLGEARPDERGFTPADAAETLTRVCSLAAALAEFEPRPSWVADS